MNNYDLLVRGNKLRRNVLQNLRNFGSGFSGDFWNNPIFQFCDNSEEALGYTIAEIPKSAWKDWNDSDNQIESEVSLVVATPEREEDCLSDIHSHDGHVWITALGSTYGFPNPKAILLRGKFESNILEHDSSPIMLDRYRFGDGSFFPIQSMEPHGTKVRLGTTNIFLAVTCGKRFNVEGKINAIIYDKQRCRTNIDDYQYHRLLDCYKTLA